MSEKVYNVNLKAVMLDGVMADPETEILTNHIADTSVHMSPGEKADVQKIDTLESSINALEENVISITSANLNMLMEQIAYLQDQLISVKQTNVESFDSIVDVNDSTKDAVISVPGKVVAADLTNSTSSITAKSVQIKALDVDSVRLNVTAENDVVISNFKSEGALAKSISNAAASIHADGNIIVKDSVVGQSGYNGIEVGLSTGLASGMTIDNVQFEGTFANNVITIFGTADNAIVNISNCVFADCSNPIRISNRTNGKLTLNLINCEFTKWEGDHSTGSMDYNGAIICQDYTSKSVAEAVENNLFAPEKIEINIINCTHNGAKITASSMEEVCGSRNEKQLIYVYVDKGGGLVSYDVTRFPKLTIK